MALINIEKDPDTSYIGFEPQLLKNKFGEGLLVIGYRADEKIDVYFQPQLQLKASDYAGIGKGVNQVKAVPLQDAFLRFSEKGLHTSASFTDIQGRAISFDINEQSKKKTKPFGLLAPIGTGAENPDGLMLVFLEDFYFVRRTDTKAEVRIAGKQHKLDTFMPMDGTKMYFSRYTPRPITVTVNPNYSGKIEALPLVDGKAQSNGNRYTLQHKNGTIEIESIQQNVSEQMVTMKFSPAFPDIRNVKNGELIVGKFSIAAHEKTGVVSGKYSVRNEQGIIHLAMTPSEGWKPYPKNRLVVKMVFTMAKVFRRWPKTYQWDATLSPISDTSYKMESKWTRIKK